MNYLITKEHANMIDASGVIDERLKAINLINRFDRNRAVFAIWGDQVAQKFDEQYGEGSWEKLEDWQRDTLIRSVKDQITDWMDQGDGITDLILTGFEGTESDWYGSEYQLRETFIAR